MEDIAPALLQKIQEDFEALLQEISWTGSTYTEASEYAEAVGNALAEAFRRNLTPGTLPDSMPNFLQVRIYFEYTLFYEPSYSEGQLECCSALHPL